ncbi:MAG: hypothetical protein M1839_000506 [Geoglossum umbratile]|nr:MAG: hypothetical protein M1839_000506 [Geoglossum umbratile]
MGGAILLSKNNLQNLLIMDLRSSKINVRAVVPSNQDTIFTLAKTQEGLNTMRQDLVRAKERWDMLGEEGSARDAERLQANEHNILQNIKESGSLNRDAGNL